MPCLRLCVWALCAGAGCNQEDPYRQNREACDHSTRNVATAEGERPEWIGALDYAGVIALALAVSSTDSMNYPIGSSTRPVIPLASW